MKKLLIVLLAVVMIFSFTACGIEENITVDEDGNITMNIKETISVAEFNALMQQTAEESGDKIPELSADEIEQYLLMANEDKGMNASRFEKDGETYFTFGSSEVIPQGEINSELMTITATEFVAEAEELNSEVAFDTEGMAAAMDMPELAEILKGIKIEFSVTLPEKIIFTNGTLSKDKKTATWQLGVDTGIDKFYAYTASSDKLIDLNIKTLNTGKDKIKVVTDDKVKSITVNGKKQSSKTIMLKADGEYVIEVVTKNASKTFTVVKDSKAPTVKGVKNGAAYKKAVTVKFSDASGIKSAKLNGKKIKSGKKIADAGEYELVVTDKAGNTEKVNFTVK